MAQCLARFESLRLHDVLVVTHDMLVLLRRPPEAFGANLAAVWVVFRVNGDDVSLEAGSVSSAVVAVLALVNSPLFLSFANDYGDAAG